jgi:hypothetical protein
VWLRAANLGRAQRRAEQRPDHLAQFLRSANDGVGGAAEHTLQLVGIGAGTDR